MVCIYFIVVECVFFVYMLFDEGVFGFVFYCCVFGFRYQFLGILDQLWVVDYFVVVVFVQELVGKQIDNVVVFNELFFFIEEEIMVVVVVSGNVYGGIVGYDC